ncbi:hypothetical protein, partial [Nocardia vinacea]|uniref:hypothetical protein n=1 Tax=Nocardia vinacea TaxID=96468 RepID=UPI000594C524
LRPVQLDQLAIATGSGDRLHTLHWTATPTQPQDVAFVEWDDLQAESTDHPAPQIVVLDCRSGRNDTDNDGGNGTDVLA